MSNLLHFVYVVLANFVGWGMLITVIVGFLSFIGFIISSKD